VTRRRRYAVPTKDVLADGDGVRRVQGGDDESKVVSPLVSTRTSKVGPL
jgi:hypothetical protein